MSCDDCGVEAPSEEDAEEWRAWAGLCYRCWLIRRATPPLPINPLGNFPITMDECDTE